jgi:hypothetical protein
VIKKTIGIGVGYLMTTAATAADPVIKALPGMMIVITASTRIRAEKGRMKITDEGSDEERASSQERWSQPQEKG